MTATELLQFLDLRPLPLEGGYYRQRLYPAFAGWIERLTRE